MPTANPLSRVRAALERFDPRDRATQVAIASIGLVIALLAAVVFWPSGGDQQEPVAAEERAPGAVTELAEEALENPDIAEGIGTASSPSGGSAAAADAGKVPAAAPGAPPITDTEIKVGVAYLEDPGAGNEAAGFGGIGQVDQRRGWEAMLAEVNEDPPLGRKLVPVWYSFTTDDVQSKGAERIAQEQCAHWTQDNRVFMVWGGSNEDTLRACLTEAGVPQIGGGGGLSWSKTYEDFPYLVSPAAAALDRMATFQVDQLVAGGFFEGFKDNAPPHTPQPPLDGKPRIALLRYDLPSYKAAAEATKARLADHGLELCDGCEFEITFSSDNIQEQLDDATEVNAAIQNCKSRPDGPCTHVMFLGSTAGVRITLFYVDGAEKQAFRARLGLNTLDKPHLIRDFLGESSYPQFRDAIFVTYDPSDFADKPDAYNRCKAIFEEAGETFGGDDTTGNKDAQIPGFCDTAWYTKAVLEKAGTSLSLSSFMNGVATMVPVPSASTYVMRTKADRHDGASAVRIAEWFDECDCFEPISDIIPV